MATFAEIADHLEGYAISGCYVRRRDIIGFSAQKWTVDDTLVPRDTMLLFYYPDEPKAEQWAASELDNVTGIHGCACFKPEERWVFVSDPGEVYVVGQGDDGYEKPIDPTVRHHFSAAKCIAGGFAYVAGIGREIYKRIGPNKWLHVTDKTLTARLPKDLDHVGFDDVDGFSDDDIYACGGHGDLWHFNGKKWAKEDIPTDSNLEKICCADDGLVYVTTNRQELLIGKKSLWRIAHQDIGDQIFEEIVKFNSKVLVSTDDAIYEVRGDELVEAELSLPKMDLYSHMASGDGILVVAGANEAHMYDGKKWKKIFKFD